MIDLPGYRILEELLKKRISTLYRGIRVDDNLPVIVKVHSDKFPSLDHINSYRHEYEVGKLFNSDVIVKYYSLEPYYHGLALIIEDYGAVDLRKIISGKGMEISEFLRIALFLAEGLRIIHNSKIIHKDVSPGNILISPETGVVKFADFGISSTLETETRRDMSLDTIEGTLSYISPEQTGRMNRKIDYRTDFYSLGITFFELLCGRPLFQAKDPLEHVHCHIAKPAIDPCKLRPNIPRVIADIVLKLVEKNAEDRYQSAEGLKMDLEKCLNELKAEGVISSFTPGEHDLTDKFSLSQRLYGRDKEVEDLLSAFERTAAGDAEILIVSGSPGVGKSSLVHEIQKPVTGNWGHFITGKFDQFNRGVAYSAIVQAFEALIRQILGESGQRLEAWKESLVAALGRNGRIIADVIPKIELIIGKQPPVQELGPVESQNRFNRVFNNFVRVFAREEHPLVLFIDDLQWADLASLKLINLLSTDPEMEHFLLIVSYRDNEVNPSHPAIMALEEIEQVKGNICNIFLTPLDIVNTNQLIADALRCSHKESFPLAEQIFQKTEGNPFFVNLFLQSLYHEKVLTFAQDGHWHWDIEGIHCMQATDNVVDLMVKKLSVFPEETQSTLKLASCIGNSFTVQILSLITGSKSEKNAADLQPLLNIGMVFRSENGYRFIHDRVQEAAYSLIPDHEKERVHLEIGYILLNNSEQEMLQEHVFDIVDHLHRGRNLIKSKEKLLELSDLSLRAGKRAKKSTAYFAARQYFSRAVESLTGDHWREEYELTYTIHIELAEAEYLNGDFEKSQVVIQTILENARTAIEKSDVFSMLVYQHTVLGEYEKGIKAGRDALKLLGVDLAESDLQSALNEEVRRARENLAGREIASLINSAEMTIPEQRAAMRILMNMQPTAYMANPDLYSLIAVKMANISLGYGHIPESAKAYVTYANILSSVFGEYRSGYEFCVLGMKMSEQYSDMVQKCRGSFIYIAFLLHWTKHFKFGESAFLEGYQTGLECGDLQYAGYILGFGTANIFYQGTRLNLLNEKLEKYMSFVQRSRHQMPIDTIQAFQMALANLRGLTPERSCFDINEVKEEQYVEECRSRNVIGICYLQILKAQVLFFYDKHEDALQSIYKAKTMLTFVRGTCAVAEYNFYYSLILTSLYPVVSKEIQEEYLKQLEANQKEMNIWATNCEENFRHKYLLVAAEIASIGNQPVEAMKLYDNAIKSARDHMFIQNEALANELAARFWLTLEKEEFAKSYLEDAYRGYRLWGAVEKSRQLKEKYHMLHISLDDEKKVLDETSSITIEAGNSLDLLSIMKASQTISGEIDLSALLTKMMTVVMENAGAERGFLILIREDKLYIEAEGTVGNPDIKTLSSIPLEDSANSAAGLKLSNIIINHVKHTKESIVLDDASHEEEFVLEPHTKDTKSILCMPLLNRGSLTGILYIENSLTTGAFTKDRVKVLNLLSAQMAISIENAGIHRNLEKLVEKRTEELKESNVQLKQEVLERIQTEKELEHSLAEVQKANNKIMESIEYAKKIQSSLLPNMDMVMKHLPDNFIIWRPRDIVGGDIYYMDSIEEGFIVAVIDCTGHGVPGAFMTMIASSGLKRIIKDDGLHDPARILKQLNFVVKTSLQQDTEHARSDDGMDAGICLIKLKEKSLVYSGARLPLVYTLNGETNVIKGDRNSIGYKRSDLSYTFTNHQIAIERDARFYMATDGLIDQLGGVKERSFGLKRFKQVLTDHNSKPFEIQKKLLLESFEEHRGGNDMQDDLTVVGFGLKNI